MPAVRRVGSFLQVQDGYGCRLLLCVNIVQALSDTDLMRNETFITAAGRAIRVPQALDEIVELIAPGSLVEADADDGRHSMTGRRATEVRYAGSNR